MDRQPFRGFSKGWRVDVPAGALRLAGIGHLVLLIDPAFPNSQLRIFAPGAGENFRWPHVEPGEKLCLRPTRCLAAVSDRVATHIADGLELLNFSDDQCRQDFEREFVSYWAQRATQSVEEDNVFSLVTPGSTTREAVYHVDERFKRYVLAEDKTTLERWLRNTGANPGAKELFPTWVLRLRRPWIPSEYPEQGVDITKLLPANMLQRCLIPGRPTPMLVEAPTATGTAYVAVVIHGADQKALVKGFRSIARVPFDRIVGSYNNRPVERRRAVRVDGAWIHGRDHPSTFAEVKNRKIAIVGCGAIGSEIANLLARAGVGEQIFVDGDKLSSANVARHALGISYMAINKALGMRSMLRRRLPHLTFEHAFDKRFESLNRLELEWLQSCDLVISAGIDFDGEAALNEWRKALPRPPAHLSCWVEAFGLAGHAVLLYGNRSLLAGFDDNERPSFRLTDWSNGVATLIAEAGCGNSFQPHGIVDLQPTVAMASSLALDALSGRVLKSCRRAWMGDRTEVIRKGGEARADFTERSAVREFAWP
ncbi:MAG: ThiF family adenylyltransferase [Ramlibacter sp.]